MGDNNKMGSIFLKEFVRAIPWGIVILTGTQIYLKWLNDWF
ncbi:MAG: hypothetical protein U9M96_03555 [Thermodesulfobacteriota bacterium]|nr:hypothetical protein [Thermodesulfobacteriota bacterium]